MGRRHVMPLKPKETQPSQKTGERRTAVRNRLPALWAGIAVSLRNASRHNSVGSHRTLPGRQKYFPEGSEMFLFTAHKPALALFNWR
jgi:hypothetical protein